jgi:hypothetical protein
MLPRTPRPTVTPRRCLCGIVLHLALLPSTPETASSACPLSPPCPRSQPAEGTRAHRRNICLLQTESSHSPIRREAIPTRHWSQEGWLRFNQRCRRRAIAALAGHQIGASAAVRNFPRACVRSGSKRNPASWSLRQVFGVTDIHLFGAARLRAPARPVRSCRSPFRAPSAPLSLARPIFRDEGVRC